MLFTPCILSAETLGTFEQHYNQALRYADVSLHAESAKEFNEAILIARENNWRDKEIEATISLAELMRKTWDFREGLDLLYGLGNTSDYPLLNVRKLGRLAAIYHEYQEDDIPNSTDSVLSILTRAIDLAKLGEYRVEEAGLKNELGFFLSRNGQLSKGTELLLEAARIFESIGDMRNYSNAMTHLLENQIQDQNLVQADSIIKHLRKIVDGHDWFSNEIDFYNQIASYHRAKGDSMGYLVWDHEAAKSFVKYNNTVHNDRMASFRVLHDTKKFQEKAQFSEQLAQQRKLQLEQETERTRLLAIFLSILGLLILGVIGLLIRERNLKAKVDIANEKYHMLLVESNHRIKNNLQMIISMLEYASKDLSDRDGRAFKRMSSKIHTISALHKHLYLDVHNENVELSTYFSEIIKLYEEISPDNLQLEKHIDSIDIKSERIVYFGLILNEMLANTIEHGNGKINGIELLVNRNEDLCLFQYKDGSSWDESSQQGTGASLIKQLVKRVGGSQFKLDSTIGQYQFKFHV
ncbi:MAG: sensor histidine kinase [Flavobacteriales bacterium]